jgi:hypothetical protein
VVQLDFLGCQKAGPAELDMSPVSINYKFSDSYFVAVHLDSRYHLALAGSAEISEASPGNWQVSTEVLDTDGLTTPHVIRFVGEPQARYVANRINGGLPTSQAPTANPPNP